MFDRRAFAAVFILSFTGAAAFAQPALDAEYEADQRALQVAIDEAAGSTRTAIILPVSALENPDLAQSISSIAKDPESGVAIEGYDPVGYFTDGRAMLGDPAYRAEYDGATFFFANATHREMFLATPERFIPAYGGYCTETLATGLLTPASPAHWTMHGDRLYLTRSGGSNNAFREHRGRSIEAADQYWAQADAFMKKINFSAIKNDG